MRRAAAAALCVVAGCAGFGAIKAYPGGSRGKAEIGIVETDQHVDRYVIVDNRMTAVDGVRYDKGGYAVHLLPGTHRIGLQATLRAAPIRVQHCAFDLDVQAGCVYRPAIPSYPRAQLDESPDAEWRMTRGMTVLAECADTSYAMQVPIDCASRP